MTADFLVALERRAIWLTAAMALCALVWPGGGAPVAAGVFGGALLAGVSYWSIRRGVSGLTAAVTGGATTRSSTARALTILVGRYALLALIAYAMISRLRLSPLGLLVGASVIPIAATAQALVELRKHGKV